MEYQNENIRIAGEKSIKEWNRCRQKLGKESTVQDWEDAFSFFNDRITTRYLNPIKEILEMNQSTGEGFAAVNLQCSLIETIESFYNGWIYEYSGDRKKSNYRKPNGGLIDIDNRGIFISFFNNREPFVGLINGSDFYQNIRCGLLHETQTKYGWVIKKKHLNENIFFENIDEEKIIYRNNFQKAIEVVIEKYKRAVVDKEAFGELSVFELRENFKAKFDHICNISRFRSLKKY